MKNLYSLAAWTTLIIALVAWACVAYMHIWLQNTAQEKSSHARTADQKAADALYMSRLKVLANSSVVEREQVTKLSEADIVSIANAIEAAGRNVGASAKVSAVISGGASREMPGGVQLHTIAFIIQAEGSFAGVVQLVRTLESFPNFSSIEQFEFEKMPETERSSQNWRSSIRLQILTTSDISS